jgi:hypothetical protein
MFEGRTASGSDGIATGTAGSSEVRDDCRRPLLDTPMG